MNKLAIRLGIFLFGIAVGEISRRIVHRTSTLLVEDLEEKDYELMSMDGPISRRLRKIFGDDDPAWNPPRDTSEPKKTKLPKGRDGWSVTGRDPKPKGGKDKKK